MPLFKPSSEQLPANNSIKSGYGLWLILMMGFMLYNLIYSIDILYDGRLLDGSWLTGDSRASDRLSGPIGVVQFYDYSNLFATPVYSYILSILALISFAKFLKHKKETPKLMIAYFVLYLIHVLSVAIVNSSSLNLRGYYPYTQQIAYSRLFISCLFFIPAIFYLFRSKRVKAVFTK